MNKERDLVFDTLKLFAIFLVLWGHTIQHLLSSEYYNEPIYRIIYAFHMPLFMTIVGYFSNSLLKLSLREVVIKKGRQLLLPALSSGIILLFIECYSGG